MNSDALDGDALDRTDSPEVAAPVTLYAVRHAEKGSGPNPSLTEQGRVRANALAETLDSIPIEVIFSSDYLRCQETVSPVASKKSLEPTLIEAADPHRQIAALHQLPAGSVALLCGHANTVPLLVQALGGVCPDLEFGMFPESAYNRLLKITFVSGGTEPGRTQVAVSYYGEKSGR